MSDDYRFLKKFFRDVLILLDADRTRATLDAKEIIDFETALANVS